MVTPRSLFAIEEATVNIDEIRKLMHAQPFQPFLVRTSDGRELLVKHPDFIAFGPSSFQ